MDLRIDQMKEGVRVDSERARRSPRIRLQVPVFLRASDASGTEFVELTRTLNISATGACITSTHILRPDQAVLLTVPAPSPSSHLRTTFLASLKEYEKKTKEELLTHPLMTKLQSCNSPTDILAALRTQAQVQRQSTSGDDKLTKWLNPTVNVLYAFSSALIADIGLVVNLNQAILPRSDL